MAIETPKKWRFQAVAERPLEALAEAEPLVLEKPERDPMWEVLGKSVFEGPIKLGENIAELFPEVKEARIQIERLRERGGGFVKIADEFERVIGERPTSAQVIGNVLETALLAAPVPAFKFLKGLPALKTFVTGGMYGAGYGVARGMSEGKRLEEVVSQGITGGLTGAALLGFGGMAVKYGVRPFFSKAMLKTPEGLRAIIYPVETRLKDLGPIGETIATRFKTIGRDTQVKLGNAFIKLSNVGMAELPRVFPWQRKVTLISKDLAWRGTNSLKNLHQGKVGLDKVAPEVKKAYSVTKPLLEEIASDATEKGILVGYTKNYFPQLTPSSQKVALSAKEAVKLAAAKTIAEKESIHLQSGLKESLRRDVLENAVFVDKRFASVELAAPVLDGWIEFIDKGGRVGKIITEKMKPYLDWIVKSGQAKTPKEAIAKAYRDFFRRPPKRLPKASSLEFSREVDFPFYDPDPRRVIPLYLSESITRLETVAQFGQRELDTLLLDLQKEQGLEIYLKADRLVRAVTGQIDKAAATEKLSIGLRAIQTPLLSFAQIVNMGQNVNTFLATDLGAFAFGLQKVFTNKGMQEALKSGAILQSVIRRQLSYAGGGSRFADGILKYTGFTWTEMFNRTVAANTGMKYARVQFAKLKKNPTNSALRWRLEEMGIDSTAALKRGMLVEKEVLRAGNIMSATTQFLSEPLYLPAFASSPWGKVVFQYKNFAYNQAKFIKRQLINPKIPLSRKFRTLMFLSLVYPMVGEVTGDIRSLVTFRKRPTKALDRYLDNIIMAGTYGLVLDVWASVKFGSFTEAMGGPTVGAISDLVESHYRSIVNVDIDPFAKYWMTRTGVLRPLRNYLYPPKAKNLGDTFEFWGNLF